MMRRSKLQMRLNVGQALICPCLTTGRSLTNPKDTPTGQEQHAATVSTPYLAGDVTRAAAPRYRSQSRGKKYGSLTSNKASQTGNRLMTPLNCFHCSLVCVSLLESSESHVVISDKDFSFASRMISTKAGDSTPWGFLF